MSVRSVASVQPFTPYNDVELLPTLTHLTIDVSCATATNKTDEKLPDPILVDVSGDFAFPYKRDLALPHRRGELVFTLHTNKKRSLQVLQCNVEPPTPESADLLASKAIYQYHKVGKGVQGVVYSVTKMKRVTPGEETQLEPGDETWAMKTLSKGGLAPHQQAAFMMREMSKAGVGVNVREKEGELGGYFFHDRSTRESYIFMEKADGDVYELLNQVRTKCFHANSFEELNSQMESAMRAFLTKLRCQISCGYYSFDHKSENMLYKRVDETIEYYLADFDSAFKETETVQALIAYMVKDLGECKRQDILAYLNEACTNMACLSMAIMTAKFGLDRIYNEEGVATFDTASIPATQSKTVNVERVLKVRTEFQQRLFSDQLKELLRLADLPFRPPCDDDLLRITMLDKLDDAELLEQTFHYLHNEIQKFFCSQDSLTPQGDAGYGAGQVIEVIGGDFEDPVRDGYGLLNMMLNRNRWRNSVKLFYSLFY